MNRNMRHNMPMEFELKPEHVKLLRRAYVGWQDCETGAPEINPKRPYGNSDVAHDVAEILGVNIPDEDDDRAWREWDKVTSEKMLAWHYETAIALQVVLSTGSFQPGRYKRCGKFAEYDTQHWEPVGA